MKWERVQLHTQQQVAVQDPDSGPSSSGPGTIWGHTCNAIKGGKFLYVFGGYGNDNCQSNQVHVFDTGKMIVNGPKVGLKQTWSQPAMNGMPPTPRDSHTCTAVGDNLFVFGGTDGRNPLKDLHILDTYSHTWVSPSIRGEGPEAREGHSAALIGKRIFIFGGCGKSPDTNHEVYYNDLHILNTETLVWIRAITTGTIPSARDGHTCSSWKNKFIVIGGEDGRDYYLSDVHILDTDTLLWKKLITLGQELPPRAGHSIAALGKNLFIFGGFTDAQNLYNDLFMFDVDTRLWTEVIPAGTRPSARFSMAGDCLDPTRGGVLVFIGGCNKSLEALDDMYYLYTEHEHEQRLENISLRKQLKRKCEKQTFTNSKDKRLVRGNQVQFQATITGSSSSGHTIETIIDGKHLRGILFARVAGSIPPTDHNSKRQSSVDQDPADSLQRKVSTSHARETAATQDVRSHVPSVLLLDKDPEKREPHSAAINLNEVSNDGMSTLVTTTDATLAPNHDATLAPNQVERIADTEHHSVTSETEHIEHG